MPAGEFHTGDESKVEVGAQSLPSRSWSLNITGNVKNVSNTRDGRKRIKGLVDATGSVEMPWDGGVYLPRHGDTMALKLYTSTTEFFQLSAIVENATPGMNFEGELVYSVAFSLESGTITYPIYS